MRFQALPSISRLEPADRRQKTTLFESLTPAMQEEFLRSEEPAAGGLAMGGGPVAQSQPVTDRAALLAMGRGAQPAAAAQGNQSGPASSTRIEPVQEGVVERLLAERSPLPSATQQLKTIGGMAVPTLTGIGGAMMGGAVGGPAGAVAGGAAGGVYGTRLATQLGLTEPEEPLVNTVLGPVTPSDVLNVGVPVASGALAPIAARVGNALGGVVKPAYQSVVDLGKKYGIRLSYGDVTQGSVAPKVESALEAIPGSGAGRMRKGQQADVTKAGETIQTGLKTEMQHTPWRDLPSVQRAASGTGPRAKEAQVLLDEIAEAGDDWGRVIQASGKVNLFQDRVRAEKLYDRVETLAQPLGNMRLPKATQAIDDAIARASDDVLPSPEVKREVIGALNRIKGEMSPSAAQPQPSMGVRDPVTGALRAAPVTQATNIPDTTYTRMRRLRSSLGDLQREAAEPATARYLSGVKTALEEDLEAFAKHSGVPELVKAGKQADTFYRTRIVPYREGTLAKAIEKNLPDEIYNQFVRRGKDRAQYFYNGLDTKGQAAVRYGMVEEAIEKANSGKPDVFSPARFATSLKKIQDAHGVFFKGTPQWEIGGITKLMQHAERAAQYVENPPTGLRGSILTGMIGGGVGGGVLINPIAAVAAVGTLLQARQLRSVLMTTRGRNFLLAASDMQPGSSAFQKRLDAFLRTLPAGSAGTVAAARAPEETAGSRR
jgi:hypothetical protein